MLWFSRKRRPVESEFEAELQHHIESLMQEKLASGLTPEQARREAVVEFGGREQYKDELRDVHRVIYVERAIANLRFGLRQIAKAPGFSLAVILTLALGVGANSAVFSALDAILFRPLPFPDADELTLLSQKEIKTKNPVSFVAPPRLVDWDRLNSTFQNISGWYTEDASETTGTLPEKVTEALVAPKFFRVWGVSPALGRDFNAEEEHFGGPGAAIISDRYWRRKFRGDPHAIGKRIVVEKWSYTVVGVMPGSFAFPNSDVEIWTPNPMDAPYSQNRESTWFNAIGRLKPDVSIASARADLNRIQSNLGRQYPKTDARWTVDIQSLKETTIGGVRRSLWMLFASVSLLLLIACTNIAAMLLARSANRERELAVRFSLGASRSIVICQLLSETFLLALGGACLGLLLAAASMPLLRSLAADLPRVQEISLNWHIVVYTLFAAIMTTLIAGLLPAIRASRRSLLGNLASGGRTQVSAQNRGQWVLAGIQVALAVTLLAGAGLLLRSFQELGRVSAGFDYSHVLTFRVSANWGETADYPKLLNRIENTLTELRSVPGVAEAATTGFLPGMPADAKAEVGLEGRAASEGKIIAESRFISDGYFSVLRIPMIAGEPCSASTHSTDVIVNRSFVSKYLNGLSPLGRKLRHISNIPLPIATIRGIAADAREEGLNREPSPNVYWCINAPFPSPYFLLRTKGEPLSFANAVRRKIQTFDPARSVYDVASLDQKLSDSRSENRLRTTILTVFALTAVALAGIGVYGTLSYFVSARRREVGLRLALGARPSQIWARFFLKGLGVSLIACGAGLTLTAGVGRLLSTFLFGVSPSDAETLLGVVLIILAVAGIASFWPAFRAAKLEPQFVLREE